MGVCCTQGARGENVDKNERNIHSNSILAPVEEKSGRREEDNGNEGDSADESKFRSEALKITTQNKNASVRYYIANLYGS